MIELTDKHGEAFNLLATRASDASHYATRKNIRKALDQIKELGNYVSDIGESNIMLAIQRSGPKNLLYTQSLQVGVILKRGILQLGCHIFSRATSKRIIRWA